MTSKADQLALKAILRIAVFIALLLTLRYGLAQLPNITQTVSATSNESSLQQIIKLTNTKAQPNFTPLTFSTPIPTPTPIPKPFSVRVVPKQWSERIDVPRGYIAKVTFRLGRIRVERNGRDGGILFRKPIVHGERINSSTYGFDVNLLAMLDKTPRTLFFVAGTRTLRFMSAEGDAGEILIEFCR